MPSAILLSPGPVDGYPPVQHQARLLADRGYRVMLITVPLPWTEGSIVFGHPGVEIICVATPRLGFASAGLRAFSFCRALLAVRLRAGGDAVEIAFDPTGMFYSDVAPCKPGLRIAHFHEALQEFEGEWREARLATAIHRFDAAIVPGGGRAAALMKQLGNIKKLFVVENYPLLRVDAPEKHTLEDRMTVIYSGSLGSQQMIDIAIRSIPMWRNQVELAMIGNDKTPFGRDLHSMTVRLALENRVTFHGWQDYDRLPQLLDRAHIGIAILDVSFEQWQTALGASNKRYEYMRSGLPQIGDRSLGVPDLIEAQGVGMCVREPTAEEIARCVNAYADDPDRLAREGRKALALHREKYNYQAVFGPVIEWINGQLGVEGSTKLCACST